VIEVLGNIVTDHQSVRTVIGAAVKRVNATLLTLVLTVTRLEADTVVDIL